METHVLGFPRIGSNRELKKGVESYWKGISSPQDLFELCKKLKLENWEIQKKSGLTLVTTGDFSLYDHVLDTLWMFGAIPERFQNQKTVNYPDTYFQMARGDTQNNISAMEMTKWFDTNYHYIVPEFTPDMKLKLSTKTIIEDTRLAISQGYQVKPVLLGPITFLSLGKEYGGKNRWDMLSDLIQSYQDVLSELSLFCDWIQIDEPVLCTDMTKEASALFAPTLQTLKAVVPQTKILLASYFGSLDNNMDLALSSGCDAIHLDLVRGKDQLDDVLNHLPQGMSLSAGLVDGRNIWKNDLKQSLFDIEKIIHKIGKDRLLISSSCSLLHTPVDLNNERDLDPEIKSWMSFAVQKCREIGILGEAIAGEYPEDEIKANEEALLNRQQNKNIFRKEVRDRIHQISPAMLSRKSKYPIRKDKQRHWLKLPMLPMTTIGSFPQTDEIRNARAHFKQNIINSESYENFLKQEIATIVSRQESLGLDVLVHGEPERNDMVEYFGQQMEGFCFTQNGWVQSYGSRCVKPPIIYGDVSRPHPMTVKWITYAQSLTTKPMKGMLTGPVTILCWSFVRNDLARSEVCKQISLAIRDEVMDLEKAGIKIIQIDEAALREGLPLRKIEKEDYLRWAVDSFKLASSGVSDDTQIHTHMCYSEFNAIIEWIAQMDADVISIESSRSKMELLSAFKSFQYPNEVGPGIYDIHSPRVPTLFEIKRLIRKALEVVPIDQLWINPDCGLKTRKWSEVLPSLRNMVQATHEMRVEGRVQGVIQ